MTMSVATPGKIMKPFAALILVALAWLAAPAAFACPAPAVVCAEGEPGDFALVRNGRPAALLVDPGADPAVQHAASGFARDLERISGHDPARIDAAAEASGDVVVVGVLGHSAAIDDLVRTGRIAAADIAGEWEAYRQIVIDDPWPGVARALVIVGSDRRGAVFGLYDISEHAGVSPWHWFADVPVQRRANLHVTAGSRRDQPGVRYRGFFINDEAPAFSSWAQARFGGVNADAYEHVFDLLLRMKGNYLWPAMWEPRAFAADDPRSMVLADEMGVIMGTSHHEPMTRAHAEWNRDDGDETTGGPWNYATNAENLRTFWRGGIERMTSRSDGGAYENVVTLGMRGNGDEAMSEDTAIQLLETIVADQRRILAEVTGRPADQTPQVWALYKEVQDYYDQGMDVPDHVTLLFADDNWGQIRRLPTADLDRAGGYGVYYHFDYVGAPRNYKWLNTSQIEKTWQQMDLAWARGARQLWIVNVGDIKPMEFPLGFFMRQAWDPEAMTLEAMTRYPEDWARATFGPEEAAPIAQLVTRYSQHAARRKPELITADSFPLGASDALDGGEFGRMIAEWDALEREAAAVKARLPQDAQDAYFQLVEHPIAALANLYRLYYAVALNQRLVALDDPRANAFADQAEAAFRHDGEIAAAYHALGDGRWAGMMSQTHIGYTTWQQPDQDVMPEVRRVAATAQARPFVADPSPAATDLIAIEAPDYARAVGGVGLDWATIPNLGRTLGAVAAFPQGRAATTQADGVRLEYDVSLERSGPLTVQLYLVPTLDVSGGGALRIGVSIDDGPMQVLTDRLTPAPTDTTTQEQRDWNRAVETNARILETTLPDVGAGDHVVRLWRVDDNVVVQKIVLSRGPVPPSYLGPVAREVSRPAR